MIRSIDRLAPQFANELPLTQREYDFFEDILAEVVEI